MILQGVISTSLLASLTLASPILNVRNNDATAIIQAVAPKSVSCDNVTTFADECATASHAAQYLPAAMQKYEIFTPGEIAAVLSLMAYETGDFRYDRNHFPAPGRPGQGTRNLQFPKYNLLYALDNPELKDKALEIVGGDVSVDGNDLPDDKKAAILDLVLPDDYSWGSAAWYYRKYCNQLTRDELAKGTIRGYTLYMEECIGTTFDEGRLAYWQRAKAAFNLS
ncbi:hypothetical protein CCHL11_01966 [Colletotrichum chlorophyti]|uniref:Uncharacterized protein n=1 Tax=Colletotrichum chlorophyti TaxID=708187 RepID=A0A1Q8RW76_9PEZI|nr:hypothetical protein CCHL11_01966 [Colletotrichum chlorophyti]